MTMQQYQKVRQAVSQQLQILSSLSFHYGENHLHQQLNQIKEVLEKKKFEVIVAGEFSNGKSTFLNALLKERLLPSGITPTTTILNRIEYADEPTYRLTMRDGEESFITEEQFRKFTAVHMDMQSEEIEKIRHVTIGYPTVFCKNDVVLIDSPGTNDTSPIREEITNSFIPRSDAVILLMHAEQILPESTMSFLQRILSEDIYKIFFVINFKDTVEKEAEEEVFQYAKERIEKLIPNPILHFVAAKSALDHYQPLPPKDDSSSVRRRRRKRQARQLTLEESGIPQLSEELLKFLASTSGKDRLLRISQQMLKIARELESEYINYQLQLYTSSGREIKVNQDKVQKELKVLRKQKINIPQRATRIIQSHLQWVEREVRRHLMHMQKELEELFYRKKDEIDISQLQMILQHRVDPLEGQMKENIQKYLYETALPQLQKMYKEFIHQDEQVRQALEMPVIDVTVIQTSAREGFTLEDGLTIGAVVGVTSLIAPTLGIVLGALLGYGATQQEEETPQAASFKIPVEETVAKIHEQVEKYLYEIVQKYTSEMERRIRANEVSLERYLDSMKVADQERREKEKKLIQDKQILTQLIQVLEHSYLQIQKTL